MTTQFPQAPSNDGFVSRLHNIEQALSSKATLVTSSLQKGSKISLGFFCRWVVQPLFARLFKIDTLACYRAHTVAANILQYCKSNTAFMDDTNKARVVAVLDTLNAKTKQKHDAAISAIITDVKALEKTEFVPAKETQNTDPTRLARIAATQSYDIHEQLAAKGAKSFAFSPSALGQVYGVMALGAKEQDQVLFAQSLGLSLAQDTLTADVKALETTSGKQMIGFVTEQALSLDETAQAQLKNGCKLVECVRTGRTSPRNIAIARLTKETGHEFKEFLKSGETDTLVHAIALKALVPTSSQNSVKRPFTFSDRTSCETQFHLTQASVKISQAINFALYEIDCGNGLSKVIVKPHSDVDFATLLDSLKPEDLAGHRAAATAQAVKLYMPAINQEQRLDVGALLKEKQTITQNFADKPLNGVKTGVYFEEQFTTGPALENADDAQELFIDGSFYWYIMQNDQTVVQGQVDSVDGLKKDEPRRFFGLFS